MLRTICTDDNVYASTARALCATCAEKRMAYWKGVYEGGKGKTGKGDDLRARLLSGGLRGGEGEERGGWGERVGG